MRLRNRKKVIKINEPLDEQYQFIDNAPDEESKYMVVQREEAVKPVGKQKYRMDYLSTYGDSEYGSFIAQIGRICTEVRAKGKTAEAMAEGLLPIPTYVNSIMSCMGEVIRY